MKEQWEYDVYRMNNVSGALADILTKHGEEGWELVFVRAVPPMTELIFKRRKEAK